MTNFQDEMKKVMGENPTAEQLWALTKFAKNVRLRCRNNTAFNNFMNATFPHARFRTVTKTRPSKIHGAPDETYPGLQITVKNPGNAEEIAGGDEE